MVDEREDTSLNLSWLAGCCVAGAVIIALAFILQTFYKWTGASIEALIEGGIATAFVGLAFLFERRFVRGIARAASKAAKEQFSEETKQMQARIDELTESVRARESADAQAHDEVISALEFPTYGNIVRALVEAYSINAFASGHVKVTASAARDLLSLRFSTVLENDAIELMILIDAERDAQAHPSTHTIILWGASDSAEDVGHKVSKEIQKRGLLDDLNGFDWSLALMNLRKSIDVAVKSTTRIPGEWRLAGKLYELLGADWAITTAGIENRQHSDFAVRIGDGYQHRGAFLIYTPVDTVVKNMRDKRPEWCGEDDWDWIVRRAYSHVPVRS